MNVGEIAVKLVELHSALVAKLGEQPKIAPQLSITQSGNAIIVIYGDETYHGKSALGKTVEDAFQSAFQIVAEMPTLETRAMQVYVKKLADAVDHAQNHNIDEKYVAPARITIQAMTENLLTAEVQK